MSWGAGSATHRAGVLRLLEGFRARGVPVDTLGIQSHLVTSGPDIGATVARQEGDWRAFLDAVVAMEYRLIFTELDVRATGLEAPFAEIGKASCRQRVCNNVSISEFAIH